MSPSSFGFCAVSSPLGAFAQNINKSIHRPISISEWKEIAFRCLQSVALNTDRDFSLNKRRDILSVTTRIFDSGSQSAFSWGDRTSVGRL